MRKIRVLVLSVFIYVIMQFCWWAYTLVKLNNEVFIHKSELIKMQETDLPLQQLHLSKLEDKLNARWWMIAGEGLVFIGLLIFGIYKILEAYAREMALTRQQKNFLLSITHEFKSPLAAVKLNMQTLQRHQLTTQQSSKIIQSSIDETNRLNKLVEDALTAAQIEAHTYSLQIERFDISKCITHALQSRTVVARKNKAITTSIQNEVYIKGDYLAATSIILNLVDNAEKYTGDDGNIEVKLYKKNKSAILEVIDNGIGVPEKEKTKIFEKFYRIGNEDTRNTKGTGLGLFIVDQLVKMHHATVSVLNNQPAGTIFKVAFPLS